MCLSCALRGKCEYRLSDPWLFNHRRSYTNLLPPNRRADLYQLFLAINVIEHTKTKVKSPQTNGICERFHKTILQEFYQVTFRKKIYEDIDQLQNDLDLWIVTTTMNAPTRAKSAKAERPCRPWRTVKKSGRKCS